LPIEGEGLPYVIDGFQRIDGSSRVRRAREMPLKGWLVEFPAMRMRR
jgi:hypothetical protein